MLRKPFLLCVVICIPGCQSFPGIDRLARNGDNAPATQTLDMTPDAKAGLQIAIADAAAQRGELETALKAYEKARREGGDRPDILHRMALTHDKLGQTAEAQELFEILVAKYPGDHEVHCDCGYHYYLGQQWQQAEAQLREAIALKPDHNRARNILGMLLARTGRIDAALSEFARAGVSQSEAHANIALAMVLQENEAEAIRQMNLVASLNPSSDLQDRLATYRGALDSLRVRRESQREVGLVSYELSDASGTSVAAE